MSKREASCPACGASVQFTLASSLLRVCEHCGVALIREGATLANYGRVAEILPTDTQLRLGAQGRYSGAPPFTLVGRLQLDYGEGTWDEWLMAFEGGGFAWLAEAQGRLYYLGEVALPPAPRFEDLTASQTLDLGPPGTFVVSEVRTARFMTAAGELPFGVPPGSLLNYADLSGPKGELGTLDYGIGSDAEALYVGQEVTLKEMGLSEFERDEEASVKATATALRCPQCGGPIELRAKETQRVACPYCGSLLDAAHGLNVLEALKEVREQPAIPLGSQGQLEGVKWTVVGFMVRSTTDEGIRYPWREYLLHEPHHGFRWLVESEGHFSFLSPVPAGEVDPGESLAQFRGETYRHYQSSLAQVDEVLGEFYWAVARGDTAQTDDFVHPPFLLSIEKDATPGGQEMNCSAGRYVEAEEVWKAFSLKGAPPRQSGVAPNQPSPGGSGSIWGLAFLFLGLLSLGYLAFSMRGGQRVIEDRIYVPQAPSGSPEAAFISEPFELKGSGNVEVNVTSSSIDNSWLYFDGALINEDTSTLDEFELEVSYYHGSDSDGSWSEGARSASAYIGSVPSGHYRLRLAPQWEGAQRPIDYDVRIRRAVPRFYQVGLAAFALLVWPIAALWRRILFEARRWNQSDHPLVTSSDD